MEVKVLETNDLSIRFIIRGMPVPIANSLRRVMVAEVPTMAIEDVFVIENSSPMEDEVLAHRLGLIPLKTDLDAYVLPEECDCKSEMGCSKCSVLLTLDVAASDSIRTAYSGELKSSDPRVVPVSDKIPIVKLAPGQRVQLEAYAKLGRGKTHAKWQPVSACVYKYLPVISIDPKKCDACGKCVDVCPKDVLKVEENKLIIVDLEGCSICKECEKACPQHPTAIRVTWVKDAVEFFVESTGALKPERIVGEAIKILRNKTDELIKQSFEKERKEKVKKVKKVKVKK